VKPWDGEFSSFFAKPVEKFSREKLNPILHELFQEKKIKVRTQFLVFISKYH